MDKIDKDGWSEIRVLPTLGDVARFCGRFITRRHCETVEVEHGAEAMLEHQMELDFIEGTEY